MKLKRRPLQASDLRTHVLWALIWAGLLAWDVSSHSRFGAAISAGFLAWQIWIVVRCLELRNAPPTEEDGGDGG